MSGSLHGGQLALSQRTVPMAGNSRNQAMSPHLPPSCPGTRHTVCKMVPAMSGSLHCSQPAPRQRIVPMAGNPATKELDLRTSRAQFFSRAQSASCRFFMFSVAKASERAGALGPIT